jgi:hypothetical protein
MPLDCFQLGLRNNVAQRILVHGFGAHHTFQNMPILGLWVLIFCFSKMYQNSFSITWSYQFILFYFETQSPLECCSGWSRTGGLKGSPCLSFPNMGLQLCAIRPSSMNPLNSREWEFWLLHVLPTPDTTSNSNSFRSKSWDFSTLVYLIICLITLWSGCGRHSAAWNQRPYLATSTVTAPSPLPPGCSGGDLSFQLWSQAFLSSHSSRATS